MQPIHHINFDIQLLGDCDVIVAELARRAGWTLEHDMLPADQTVDVACINEEDHEYSVKLRNAKPVVEPQTELKLEALKKKHDAKLKAMKEEMEQLIALKDQKHREEIEELQANLRDVRGKLEKVEKANEYLRKEHTTEASCLKELAKLLAEDIKEREKTRLFLEKAEMREAWMLEELRHATQARRSSNILMTAFGCALGAGALVVTQDMNLAMKIATSVAKTTLGQNAKSAMEDYLPKAFR